MNHVIAFIIKITSNFIFLFFILGFLYNITVVNVLTITITLSILSYIIGDLMILPRTSNAVATVTDFGIAMAVIWILSVSLTTGNYNNLFTMSLISSAGIAFFESFFHKYFVIYVVYGDEDNELQDTFLQYHTETAEEFYPSELISDDNKDIEKQKSNE
ncbi:DUF2512 family protein [Cytobacillus dafuensis]|uniref:DUF2512 family protein n=1 Tax=Cytobacillus dafuensis TaxID=1742359 RepID=A0A5B8Z804_CYTDA|nr:DUF2512 family protein [Cytobacillus dafuensis]QED47839.1 DUF2512 family protein [Cytobacillus dafuensis]